MIIDTDTASDDAVALIMAQGVAFCMTSGGIGIVSAADLGKPVCTLWVLGRILDFENALTALFPSMTSRNWKAGRPDSWIAGVDAEVERRKRDGTYLTEEDCLTFAQKLSICREWLRDTFPPDGKSRMSDPLFRSAFGWLSKVRNDLAHGRSPQFGRGGYLEFLRRLDRLDDYTARLWTLVADREDVWDRYAESEIREHAAYGRGLSGTTHGGASSRLRHETPRLLEFQPPAGAGSRLEAGSVCRIAAVDGAFFDRDPRRRLGGFACPLRFA